MIGSLGDLACVYGWIIFPLLKENIRIGICYAYMRLLTSRNQILYGFLFRKWREGRAWTLETFLACMKPTDFYHRCEIQSGVPSIYIFGGFSHKKYENFSFCLCSHLFVGFSLCPRIVFSLCSGPHSVYSSNPGSISWLTFLSSLYIENFVNYLRL